MRYYSAIKCSFVVLLFILSGCSQTPEGTPTSSESNAKYINDLPSSIAILPFANQTNQVNAPQMLRRTLFGHLARTNYQFSHLQYIDNQVSVLRPTNGFTRKDAQMLSQMLDVEGMIFGEVLSYNTVYAGVFAQISFEVKVSLVSATGELIWSETFEEVATEGAISLSPWSVLYGLAVTAMHLDDDNLFAVADKLGRKIAGAIPQPRGFKGYEQNFIESVIHDASGKLLKYGDALSVGIKGQPNKTASVKIQGINQVFMLNEVEPGVYLGDIDIVNQWNGRDLLLTGYLRDGAGQISKAISPVGLIQIDNIGPASIDQIKLTTSAHMFNLSWRKVEPNTRVEVYLKREGVRTLLSVTEQSRVTIEHKLPAFSDFTLEMTTVDRANNTSDTKELFGSIYPVSSMANAEAIEDTRLPAKLDGQYLLKKRFGPYLVDQKVVLSQSSSLYIEPGTILQYSNQGHLQINGSVLLFGGEPVLLQPLNREMTAQTFLTLDSSEHVDLNGIEIVGAGIAIEVLKGKPQISHCMIAKSQYSALVLANMASVKLKQCTIDGSNTSAVVVKGQARLNISDSVFKNNMPFHIQSSSVFEVEAQSNQWSPEASPMTILGNVRY
jgi:hypothetical protein